MASVADYADEFVKRAKAGKKPSMYVEKPHLESFLGLLARDGFGFAKDCLAQISDPEIRRIIETLFFSTAAGAALGGAVGGMIAGPAGVKVGAVVGAGVGFAAGCVALVITAKPKDNGLLISIA
jgi:hypothetical protein